MNDKQDAARRLGETIEIEGEVRVGNSDVPTPVARVTPADLARWRAAADAATEGPWDADVIPHDPEEPCVPEYANLEPNIGAGLTVADAGFIALARIAMPRLLDEVERLRETVTRLNRRAQIAESAINDLTREPIGGREHAPVAAEVWARCEETHGLVCRAAREARAEVSSLRTLLDPDGKATERLLEVADASLDRLRDICDTHTIRTDDLTGDQRLVRIHDRVTDLCDGARLAVIEDLPAHAMAAGKTGMAQGVVRLALLLARAQIITVTPATLKKYATGSGNATKSDMRMALYQRTGLDLRDDNQVDAWWLRAIGCDLAAEPIVSLPAGQRSALAKLPNPVREEE